MISLSCQRVRLSGSVYFPQPVKGFHFLDQCGFPNASKGFTFWVKALKKKLSPKGCTFLARDKKCVKGFHFLEKNCNAPKGFTFWDFWPNTSKGCDFWDFSVFFFVRIRQRVTIFGVFLQRVSLFWTNFWSESDEGLRFLGLPSLMHTSTRFFQSSKFGNLSPCIYNK